MSEPLDDTLRQAIVTALEQLEGASMTPDRWHRAVGQVDAVEEALRTGDALGLRQGVTELSITGFHAQTDRRLGAGHRRAPVVVPAKPSPALPLVGVVCAAGIGALGFALGGGVLAAGTGVLALFVLGVALAGTHGATARRRERHDVASPVTDGRRAATRAERTSMARLREQLERRG